MGRPAKIKAWNKQSSDTNGCSDYSMNMYWGGSQSTKYTNEFYICGDMGRPTSERIIETATNAKGQTKRIQNTSIPRYVISTFVISPLLHLLETIDKHDYKEIHFLDTGDVYTIKNIDVDDQGDRFDPVQQVFITFEDEAISKESSVKYISDNEKQAFWDNNNDGTKDIDGEAEYDTTPDVFNSWQLYYESDGVTPATGGDVKILVYAVSPNSVPSNQIESLIGVFRGVFGDGFSDASKWQSSQQIWNYFNVLDNVGHTKRCQFDKRAFAQDNGYLSTETEERAVELRFDLSIDSSSTESTTLSRAYTVVGSFNSYRIQDPTLGTYGVTVTGTSDIKNTLSTIQDIRFAAGGGTPTSPITIASLTSTTNYSNEYLLDITPTSEFKYEGSFTTKGGYIGSSFRGANGLSDDFIFTLDTNQQINRNVNILNFTTGLNPLIFGFIWSYRRQGGNSSFPALGDITAVGAAAVLLNGVLVNTVPAIVPNPAGFTAVGAQSITLPDTDVNTVKLTLPTTGGDDINTEFQVQLKALF